MRKNIAIVGSYDATADEEALAYKLGEELGRLDCHLVCGGRRGVMLRVAEGAQKARSEGSEAGVVIGILPEADKSTANRYLDVALPTGLGFYRNGLVALAGDAVVAVGGGAGTLSEISFAWIYGRPIALLGESGWTGRLAGVLIDHRRHEKLPHFTEVEGVIDWIRRTLEL